MSSSMSSQHPPTPHCLQCPSHSSCLPSLPAGSALSPAALGRGAAPGQSSLFAVLCSCHELPPSQEPSPAQQLRTSPRQHLLCPSGLPPGVPGAPGELVVKQAEVITDVACLSWGEALLSRRAISPNQSTAGHKSHFSLSHYETGHPDGYREGSPSPLLREGILLSQLRHLILGFLFWG